MSDELIRALVTVAFGSLAGGLTNTVAIWMLFHPYHPPKIAGWKLHFFQGAIPKNQPRLAAAIGRTVGNRLLTEEDLTSLFANEDFRAAFNERLAEFLGTILHAERGSLRDILTPPVFTEVETILRQAGEESLDRFASHLASPQFEELVERKTADFVRAVGDEPIAGILTPAREEALASTIDDWLRGAVESREFEVEVEDYLDRASRSLLEPGRTFEDILPVGLVQSVEKAVASYLPLAIERLGGLLDDPGARARFEHTLHELFHRFLGDLKLHQRVVARLIVTEDTLDRILRTIEAEGAERLSELLRDPAVREAMTRGIDDGIADFLRRPVTEVLGGAEDPTVLEARETVVGWTVGIARDPAARAFLVEKLRIALERAGARTWGEVLERIPPEKLSRWLISAARSEAALRFYGEGARRLRNLILDRPIGVPSSWLPAEVTKRIETSLSDPLWDWLQRQVPQVVERIDVAARVEEKVLGFPTGRMEEIVRRITGRELRIIVRLGYLLGAVIGVILVSANALLD